MYVRNRSEIPSVNGRAIVYCGLPEKSFLPPLGQIKYLWGPDEPLNLGPPKKARCFGEGPCLPGRREEKIYGLA